MVRYLKLVNNVVVNTQVGESIPENDGNVTWKPVVDGVGIGWRLKENDWTHDIDAPEAVTKISLTGAVLETNPADSA